MSKTKVKGKIDFQMFLRPQREICDYFFKHLDEYFEVPFSDKSELLTGREIIATHIYWQLLVAAEMPVTSDFRFDYSKGSVGKGDMAALQTKFYDIMMERFPDAEPAILEQVNNTISHYYNMIYLYMGDYQALFSPDKFFRLCEHDEIKKHARVNITPLDTVTEIEEKVRTNGLTCMDKLKLPFEGNILYPYLRLGLISPQQLPQVMCPPGLRSDIDDKLFTRCLSRGFAEGMKDVVEYFIESHSAKKTAFYNKKAMPGSQYNNRKQQLLAIGIEKVHPGDCGTKLLMPFVITKNNANTIIGKHYHLKNSVSSPRYTATKDTTSDLIGKTIYMRSTLTCLHRDGYCVECGGLVAKNIPVDANCGVQSVIQVLSKVSQLVLSNKHFTSTNAIQYNIPEALSPFIHIVENDIYFKKDVESQMEKLWFGIDVKSIKDLEGIKYIRDLSIIEEHFSSVTHISIGNRFSGEEYTPHCKLQVGKRKSEKMTPFFSKAMLLHIDECIKEDKITRIGDDFMWIPLEGFDFNDIFMQIITSNDSVVAFVDAFNAFIGSELHNYNDLEEVFALVTNMIYSKVTTNILHVETLLKAFLVQSEVDKRVGVVTDIKNVKFGTIKLIGARSIGSQMVYQELPLYIKNPLTFIEPKLTGPMDTIVGLDTFN